MKAVVLLLFHISIISIVAELEDVTEFNCSNGTDCYENTTTEEFDETVTAITPKTTVNIFENFTSNTKNTKVAETTTIIPKLTTPKTISSSSEETWKNIAMIKNQMIHRRRVDICECNLKNASCDINCCCDDDCKDFHLSVFSYCKDDRPKKYDSRYCSDQTFVRRNTSQFIIERIANNLFCIAYDNLPPKYIASDSPNIASYADLRETISELKESKFKWKSDAPIVDVRFNTSNPYSDNDVLWKLQGNIIKPLELIQDGFTGLCSFKKSLKYLREWKGSCLQTDLTTDNAYLFLSAFNNFTVISSPILFNERHIVSSNGTCARNVCLKMSSFYCENSWNLCNSPKPNQSCSEGICNNVVKSVRYLITHNGTKGIVSIEAYFIFINTTSLFYQDFEVIYEWDGLNKNQVFHLSGNPGYILSKPIILGKLLENATNGIERNFININKTNYFLTLPSAQKNGECHKTERYIVNFGEDLKLRCKLNFQTTNFTSTTCTKLQNETLQLLMEESLFNVSEITNYKNYISKTGNVSDTNVSSWVQIMLDRVPLNVLTGQIIRNQIRCSGLITSMRIDIVYTLLPKPKSLENYKIHGVGVTFSNEMDIFWPKCSGDNCTDFLGIDVITYVTFHDASKPLRYYFVGGPNLDITLPYDFFYPFMSDSECSKPNFLILGFSLYLGITYKLLIL